MEPEDYYIENGKYVFTETYLLKRGWCCNNGCRHCPYKGKNMESIKTGNIVPVDVEREPIKLYRFRIWLDDEGKITYDDDVYTQMVPPEMVEAFHQPGKVYSIWAETDGDVDNESGANGKILMILSDNEPKMREFMGGVLFALQIKDKFNQ